jgi:hypothetical protein
MDFTAPASIFQAAGSGQRTVDPRTRAVHAWGVDITTDDGRRLQTEVLTFDNDRPYHQRSVQLVHPRRRRADGRGRDATPI